MFFLLYWYKANEQFQRILDEYLFTSKNEFFLLIMIIATGLALGLLLHGIFRTLKFYICLIPRFRNCLEKSRDENALVWIKGHRQLPEFFSSRASIWGSMVIGFLLTLLFRKDHSIYIIVFSIIFLVMYLADHFKEKLTISRLATIIKIYKVK